MPVAIRMPDFGTAVSEIRLVKWLLEEGSAVSRGDLLAELETDKAGTELESVANGVLLQLCVPSGTTVDSGQIIAYVGEPGETAPEAAPRKEAEPPRQAPERPDRQLRVAPVVVNLAAKLGVDLAGLRGTGERGLITREDVLRADRERKSPAADSEELPRNQMAVAHAVQKSNAEIPQLRLAATLDMSAVEALREQQEPNGRKCFYEAVFVKAMVRAIEAVPLMAARLEGNRIVRPEGLHISIAVSSGNDLVLPVARDAARKDIHLLRVEIEALVERAGSGALALKDTIGGSMALSNLGMYPVDWFEALVFPGQTAIVALGAVSARPVVIDGRIEPRPTLTVTLAADHRLVNGRTAAQYLEKLKEIVESASFT